MYWDDRYVGLCVARDRLEIRPTDGAVCTIYVELKSVIDFLLERKRHHRAKINTCWFKHFELYVYCSR